MSETQIHTLPANYTATTDLLGDKVILVTGAGDGIGRVAAITFAQHGATVVLAGKTLEKLEAVYDEIEAMGLPQPALCPLDLMATDLDTYKNVAEVIEEEFGRLDGLLHNAGVLGDHATLASYKPKPWLDVMQVNVNGAFLLTQALLPLLKQSPCASVVFTSSSVGRKGRAYWGAYAVSKFATEGMMQTLADELDSISKIRVNCINPGATRTRMRAQAYPAENPETLPTPEAIMPLYLYLFGDDSVNTNGCTFDAQPK